jgi:transposase
VIHRHPVIEPEAVMGWRSGQAHSQDLRDRVLAAVDGGLRVREAAPLFRVSISYIYKALERRAATGQTTPSARGGLQRPPVLSGHEAALLGHLRANPDATLAELRRWLFETRGVSISVGALWNGLDRLGWTLKKRMARPVCKGAVGRRDGLHQRIRSQGECPGQDGSRASRAS